MYILRKSKKVNFLDYHEFSRCNEVITINSWVRKLAHSKYMIIEVAAQGSIAIRDERVLCWMWGALLHAVQDINSQDQKECP